MNYITMSLDIILTICAILLAIWDVKQFVDHRTEKIRIKAKVAVWNTDAQSIVGSMTEMRDGIDKNKIQTAKELRYGIVTVGNFANGMHESLKKEL